MFIKHVHVHVDILLISNKTIGNYRTGKFTASCVECVVQATTALIVYLPTSNKSALVLLLSSNSDSQSTCRLTISAVFSLQIISWEELGARQRGGRGEEVGRQRGGRGEAEGRQRGGRGEAEGRQH